MNHKIKNALISVSDKENISSILRIFKKYNIKIISSGGTFKVIKKLGYDCTEISKNKSLIFTIANEKLEIERSIYLGGKKILDNTCITISGNLVNKDKCFNWEIKKKI